MNRDEIIVFIKTEFPTCKNPEEIADKLISLMEKQVEDALTTAFTLLA